MDTAVTPTTAPPLLRDRAQHAKVTNEELFFDLVYAYAVTQLSHRLLGDLTAANALQTLVLWFAVWLGWQYTAWVTNWFNPAHRGMRLMLFGLMLLGLVMSSAIPRAYADGALVFAGCYAALQIGRSAFVLAALPRTSALRPNLVRIFAWLVISGALWIAGALVEAVPLRLALWIAAIGCEYISPMFGFALPGLGRSRTSDWTIDGHHLAERCQLFVIVALGESILATGAGYGGAEHPGLTTTLALLAAFVGSVAMWWIYFDTGSEHGTHAITHSDDPGRIGAYFHYIHVTLIAGIIITAVGDELVIHHPGHHVDAATALVLIAGPLVYLFGNAVYKRVVYGWFPPSHLVGIGLLVLLAPLAFVIERLALGAATSAVLVVVAVWHGLRAPDQPGAR